MSTASEVRVPPAARWVAVLLHTVLVIAFAAFVATRDGYRDDALSITAPLIILLIIDFPVNLLVALPIHLGVFWLVDRYDILPHPLGAAIVFGVVYGLIGGLYQYWLMGVVGRILARRRQAGAPGSSRVVPGVAVCVVLVAAALPWGLRAWSPSYAAPTVAFSGDSRDLKRSVVVPTLDTPLPEGKNAIWCATFQMAWDRLKDDVVGEPVLLKGAQEHADRLNQSAYPASGIEENDYYAAAGWTKDGIVDHIRDEMRKRFNKEPMDLGDAETAAIAYAYLRARVPFTIPYLENPEAFYFKDGQGKETSVSSFGLADSKPSGMYELWHQVKVLYAVSETPGKQATEYAADLCRDSKPYQIVLARVSPQPTLQDTLDRVQRAIDAEPADNEWNYNVIGLTVPDMNWSVDHDFRELTGADKPFLNRGLRENYIDTALQRIEFRLDRSGAQVLSEARLDVKSEKKMTAPLDLRFNRPFLLYITQRGGTRPFFVMWVDNAELLSKRDVSFEEASRL